MDINWNELEALFPGDPTGAEEAAHADGRGDAVKYYRVMKEPAGEWDGYRMEVENGALPDFTPFPVGEPRVGEYLSPDSDGTWSIIFRGYRSVSDVRYPKMPPVSELLAHGTIVEVPGDIMVLDLQMSEKARKLTDRICSYEGYISDLELILQNPRIPFCFCSPAQAKKDLTELRPELAELNRQMDTLKEAYHAQVEVYFQQKVQSPAQRPELDYEPEM